MVVYVPIFPIPSALICKKAKTHFDEFAPACRCFAGKFQLFKLTEMKKRAKMEKFFVFVLNNGKCFFFFSVN